MLTELKHETPFYTIIMCIADAAGKIFLKNAYIRPIYDTAIALKAAEFKATSSQSVKLTYQSFLFW